MLASLAHGALLALFLGKWWQSLMHDVAADTDPARAWARRMQVAFVRGAHRCALHEEGVALLEAALA